MKEYQRCLEVTTVLCIDKAPVLHVTQSGNMYIVITIDCIFAIFSKFDEIAFSVCSNPMKSKYVDY